jgi:hypothetical protein
VQKTIFDDRFLTPSLLLIKTSSISLHFTNAFPARLSVSVLFSSLKTSQHNTKHGVHDTTTTAPLVDPNIDKTPILGDTFSFIPLIGGSIYHASSTQPAPHAASNKAITLETSNF